jgi:opacity protein-like surface antigen
MRIALVLAALAAPSAALADDGLRGLTGSYVRADLGGALESSQDDSTAMYSIDYNDPAMTDEAASGDLDLELPSGVSAAIGFGWAKPDSNWRFEALLIHNHQEGEFYAFDADWHTLGLYAVGLYDFLPHSRLSPFVGAGVGINNVEMELDFFGDESDARASFLATAGVSVIFTESLVGDLTYRYQYTPNLEHAWAVSDPDPTTGFDAESSLATNLRQHAVLAGLRYMINPPRRAR